ncbi:hypothetical protein ACXITP_06315 [Actinotignum sanguinis]|uniref:Uncharacterized protein n=2 Tax=Actinomycetaceae TaxID=2049 RepID=A0ABZ0RCB6_9ACTO|nr:hypothetical protein [Actinotignum sanguinis]WPJ88858.1 hypothetical protein R0V15_08335 [Schaalia turicensis]MDE1656481.1 hypothetical protein [Actinotignum sanguinis]MDK7197202.1 hypothetical protein [Actinotignum sanguinis]MDK8353161.1 hypothetical protein [Actinotignum sanguinis]MDK8512469.1 hypothetical protein [Actinotignum sanguinis]
MLSKTAVLSHKARRRGRYLLQPGSGVLLITLGYLTFPAALRGDTGAHLLGRSLVIAALAGLMATVIGIFIACAARYSAHRTPYIAVAALSITVSPVALATAVTATPFNVPAYGTFAVLSTTTLTVIPVTSLIIFGMTMRTPARLFDFLFLTQTRWRIALPVLCRGTAFALAAACALACSTPDITKILGGSTSYLASHAAAIAASGRPGLLSAGLIFSGVALLLMPPPRFFRPRSHVPRSRQRSAIPTPAEHHFAALIPVRIARGIGGVLTILVTIPYGAVYLRGAFALAKDTADSRPYGTDFPLRNLVTTFGVITCGVVLSGGAALLCAMWMVRRQRWVPLCLFAATCGAGISQTMAGIFVAALHRDSICVVELCLLPPLVGAHSIGHGIVGMLYGYALAAFPIAFLAFMFLAGRSRRIIDTARTAGAGRARAAATFVRESITPIVVVHLILIAVLLTRVAPALFVESPDFPVSASRILAAAEAAKIDTTCAMAVLLGCTALALMAVIAPVFVMSSATGKVSRVHSYSSTPRTAAPPCRQGQCVPPGRSSAGSQ